MATTLNKKLIDISAGPTTNNTITGSSSNYNYNYNRPSMSTVDSDVLKDWLDTRLVKESELIEMVGKLIVERLDQLLDEDTDKVVRILIENKLFQDENTGLKKQITELEKKIEELNVRLYLIENSGNRLTNPLIWNGGEFYTQSPSTGGWTTTTVSTVNTIEDKKKNLIERITNFFEKKEDNKEQEATTPTSGLDDWKGIICTKS